jgi:hypothetical protein
VDIEGTDRPGREVSKEHRQVIEYAFGNWIADIRRKGGQWPPGRVPAEADDDQRGTQKAQGSAEGG